MRRAGHGAGQSVGGGERAARAGERAGGGRVWIGRWAGARRETSGPLRDWAAREGKREVERAEPGKGKEWVGPTGWAGFTGLVFLFSISYFKHHSN